MAIKQNVKFKNGMESADAYIRVNNISYSNRIGKQIVPDEDPKVVTSQNINIEYEIYATKTERDNGSSPVENLGITCTQDQITTYFNFDEIKKQDKNIYIQAYNFLKAEVYKNAVDA